MSGSSESLSAAIEAIQAQAKHQPYPTAILSALLDYEQTGLTQLRMWTNGLIVLPINQNFTILNITSAFLLLIVFLVGSATLIRQSWTRRIWIFRLRRTAEGTHILPHAMNTFLVGHVLFVALLLVYAFLLWYLYRHDESNLMSRLNLVEQCALLVSWTASYFAMVGTYLAPAKVYRSSKGTVGKLLAPLRVPMLVNIVILVPPFLIMAGMLPPAILSSHQLASCLVDYKAFAAQVDNVIATNATITDEVIIDFVAQSSSLWDRAALGNKTLEASYGIYAGCTGGLLLFIPAGALLTMTMLRDKLQMEKKSYEMEKRGQRRAGVTSTGSQAQRDVEQQQSTIVPIHDVSTDRTHLPEESRTTELRFSGAKEKQTGSDQIQRGSLVFAKQGFFARLFHRKQQTVVAKRYFFFRRCYYAFIVFYVGLFISELCYCVSAARLAALLEVMYLGGLYGAAWTAGTGSLIFSWNTALFGGMTFAMVCSRLLDPVSLDAQGQTPNNAASAERSAGHHEVTQRRRSFGTPQSTPLSRPVPAFFPTSYTASTSGTDTAVNSPETATTELPTMSPIKSKPSKESILAIEIQTEVVTDQKPDA